MKKFLFTSLLALAVIGTAMGQASFLSQSLITPGITAIQITNTLAVTNLAYPYSTGTNAYGVIYTNNGVKVTVATNVGDYVNLFTPGVRLWADRNGRGWGTTWGNLTNASAVTPPVSQDTPMNVSITMRAESAADSAVTFVLTTVPDGENMATEAAEKWTFSFTPTVSTTQTFVTNAPAWLWTGRSKIALWRVSNGDTDAASGVYLLSMRLNGFVP